MVTLTRNIFLVVATLCLIAVAGSVALATVDAQESDEGIVCVVDEDENGFVDISELFNVIDWYFDQTRCVAPEPTATPTPDNGDWVYFGPDCPDAYPNCASVASDLSFIYLPAYDHFNDTNDESTDTPYIQVVCHEESPLFAFNGGGLLIGAGETGLNLYYQDQEVSEASIYFTEESGSTMETAWFDSRDSRAILWFIEQADRQDRDVRMGVVGYVGGDASIVVVADFDVTGYAVNYERLPCP